MIVLTDSELREILPTLSDHYPKSIQLDAMIRNRLNGRCDWPGTEFVVDRYPEYSVLMCRPVKNHPNYVCWPRAYCVTLFCRNLERLEDVLREDDFVDWTQRVAFFAVEKKSVSTALLKRFHELGSIEPMWESDHCGIVHLLHPSHLVKSELPEGFRFGELLEAHAEQINREWKYGTPDSLPFVQTVLRNKFPSSGIFTSDGSRLVAYILYMTDGSMFNGYVDPEFRYRGLYQAVNYDLACKVVALGQPSAFLYVIEDNEASLRSYAKLGAKRVDPAEWCVDWQSFTPPPPVE
ncbi:hypothetical protein BV898_16907 [Hypsibius exemplaris]|uniref:Glycine N-acyltransferase-like protein n=1 Tax=Hypsibius exemplaris TaxID=2072580 RepID=A0A9X6NG66_HYPEX|nr:hypothetical protein BV898_16907 [Hypsibius exemplaris]